MGFVWIVMFSHKSSVVLDVFKRLAGQSAVKTTTVCSLHDSFIGHILLLSN